MSNAGSPTAYQTRLFKRWGVDSIPAMVVDFSVAFALIGLLALSGKIWHFTSLQALGALTVFAFMLLMLLLKDALVFFLSFSLIATLAPMVASVTYLEFGNFISEQGVRGYATGAATRLVFYCLVAFLGLYAITRPLLNRMPKGTPEEIIRRFTRRARGLHIAVLLGAMGLLLFYGSPLLRGEDRFAYYASVPDVFSRLPFLIAMMSFLIVCTVAVRPNSLNAAWAIGLVVASVGILVLFSEKFTGLYSIFVLSVTGGYCAALYLRGITPRVGRLILLCLTVGIALLAVASVGYMVFYGYTPDTVLTKLADRALALNGHVWFGTDRTLQSGGPNGPASALFPQPSYDGLSGIQQVMYLVAPADFVDRMIAGDLRFANVGFPLPVWVLGYGWATLYFLIAGATAGLVLSYLMFSLSRMRIVSVLVALNGLRQVTNALLVGDVSDIYKPLALVTWAFIVADLTYTYSRQRHSTMGGNTPVKTLT